jgi:hypothetical protein
MDSLTRTTEDWYTFVGAILVIAHREAARSGANTRFAPTRCTQQCPNVVWSDLAPSWWENYPISQVFLWCRLAMESKLLLSWCWSTMEFVKGH